MPETRHVTLSEAKVAHNIIMERTGYKPSPLRDAGALESALARPQIAAHYGSADLVKQAAILAVSISQAQAFVDGNKRTAFAVANAFVICNGYVFAGDPVAMAQRLESVSGREGSLDAATQEFEAWLRQHLSPLPER